MHMAKFFYQFSLSFNLSLHQPTSTEFPLLEHVKDKTDSLNPKYEMNVINYSS